MSKKPVFGMEDLQKLKLVFKSYRDKNPNKKNMHITEAKKVSVAFNSHVNSVTRYYKDYLRSGENWPEEVVSRPKREAKSKKESSAEQLKLFVNSNKIEVTEPVLTITESRTYSYVNLTDDQVKIAFSSVSNLLKSDAKYSITITEGV